MKYLTESELKTLPIGTRVAFPDGASAYPDFNIAEAMTGTVDETAIDCIWVKIDQHHASLDEWDNRIQVWFWDDENDQASHNLTTSLARVLNADDDSLSEFVRAYCDAHSIECDGDIFGMLFSEHGGQWSETEAAAVIEEAAGIYNLRR